MLHPIRWAVVALLTSAPAAPALAGQGGEPHDGGARPCTLEGYDAVRMQAVENPCAAVPTRGAKDGASGIMPRHDARDEGSGAGEPRSEPERAPDPFQARIWTGP